MSETKESVSLQVQNLHTFKEAGLAQAGPLMVISSRMINAWVAICPFTSVRHAAGDARRDAIRRWCRGCAYLDQVRSAATPAQTHVKPIPI